MIVFGFAAALYFSAPRGALPWLMVVLLVAWIGQLIGDRLVGPDVSGFFGALAMTPIALAIARLPSGPPSQVTFLPAFWLLVPGALGLIGVTEVVGDPATAERRRPRHADRGDRRDRTRCPERRLALPRARPGAAAATARPVGLTQAGGGGTGLGPSAAVSLTCECGLPSLAYRTHTAPLS